MSEVEVTQILIRGGSSPAEQRHTTLDAGLPSSCLRKEGDAVTTAAGCVHSFDGCAKVEAGVVQGRGMRSGTEASERSQEVCDKGAEGRCHGWVILRG